VKKNNGRKEDRRENCRRSTKKRMKRRERNKGQLFEENINRSPKERKRGWGGNGREN
jgi:hypothetical protein